LKQAVRLVVVLLLASAGSASAQKVADAPKVVNNDRYDDTFRKYSKRFFGVGFDWQYFKAQGLAESGLEPTATSRVGAKGIMQLMPGTYALIKGKRAEFGAIDDPEWNIAAGIMHSRGLWNRWNDHSSNDERLRFMWAAYNAGEGTILRAKNVARSEQLDDRTWGSIEAVAPKVQRWRYRETIPYVHKIEKNHEKLSKQPRKTNAAKPAARDTTGKMDPTAKNEPAK
jgi:soluble lytic murein transglycosylase-like protein